MAAKKRLSPRKQSSGRTAPRSRKAGVPPASPPPAVDDPGTVALLTAVASFVQGVRVDFSRPTLRTAPKNLLSLRFNDRRVGLSSPTQLDALRDHLVRLLPQISGRLATLPLDPTSRIGDAARQVNTLIARAPAGDGAPDVFTLGPEGEARKKVENRFGRAFASKSSPALLRTLTAPSRESFALAPSPPALILEFTEPAPLALDPTRAASRTQRLGSMRDAFYRLASPIRATIERATGASTVQVCWLNSTIRVAGQVTAVAGVADANDVQWLDVSRTMRREMNVSRLTVRADFARTQFSATGAGVRIAVIDGEVQVGHPAFGGRVTLQENFTSEPFGSPDPHGTAVAGIIAAADAQFNGIAVEASIISYKVFATNSTTGDEFQGILALEHALRDGAEIANCSWGIGQTGDGTTREAKAFNRAWAAGLIVIKSAGNDGPGADTMTSPADADGVIVVGATEREGTMVQNYSARGPTTNGKHPHLVTPGGTDAAAMMTCDIAGAFGSIGSGTSFAAPIAAGAAALLRQQFPSAPPDEIRQRLLAMCRPFVGVDENTAGAGLLDLSMFSLV